MGYYSEISKEQWVALLPIGVACALVGFGARTLFDKKMGSICKKNSSKTVNPGVKKGEAKVVDAFDMEDIGEKASFCRCWRSSKFPYCDGTHNKYNTETGDNLGPLVLKKKSK